MGKQRVFDVVVKHLGTMKQQSIAPERTAGMVTCAYRGLNGAKCAIGVLMSDHRYRPEFAGKAVSTSIVSAALPKWAQGDAAYLNSLQEVHDSENNWGPRGLNKKGVQELKVIADTHGLSLDALQAAFPRINVANA